MVSEGKGQSLQWVMGTCFTGVFDGPLLASPSSLACTCQGEGESHERLRIKRSCLSSQYPLVGSGRQAKNKDFKNPKIHLAAKLQTSGSSRRIDYFIQRVCQKGSYPRSARKIRGGVCL